MNKKEIAILLSKKCGIKLSVAEQILNEFVNLATKALCCGEKISIRGLGTLYAKYQKESKKRLPGSIVSVVCPARFVPKFRCSEVLKGAFLPKTSQKQPKKSHFL